METLLKSLTMMMIFLNINIFIRVVKFSILIALTLKYPWLVFIVYTLFIRKKID
jgi:hypothetical protein